jgi:DNA-binding NarL/FixJ family response regulator
MQSKKIFSYVACPNDIKVKRMVEILEAELPVRGHCVASLQDLFPLLADPNFHTDFITVYIEDFYTVENADSFQIIQTLDTLIKCTVYRPSPNSKPIKRTTKIVAVITDSTTVETLKDILEFDSIAYITPSGSKCSKYTMDEILDGVRNFIEYGERVPNSIKKMLKTKNTQKNNGKDTIRLTPRQKQIFDLITTRGASNKIIAKTLHISESTVKLHMGAILKKYNVKNRTQLAVFSQKNKSLSEV